MGKGLKVAKAKVLTKGGFGEKRDKSKQEKQSQQEKVEPAEPADSLTEEPRKRKKVECLGFTAETSGGIEEGSSNVG